MVSGIDQVDPEKQPEVTLEQDQDGNSFLHLVLPATSVNFLNGQDANSMFDVGNHDRAQALQGGIEDDYDEMLIEVGCKVYEVNRVLYKSTPSDSRDDYSLSL